MPIEKNPRVLLHLKALISGKKFWGEQRCGSTLSLCKTLLKISILLHKMASGWFILILAVHTLTIRVVPSNLSKY